jgi:hypothetical protein
LRLSTENRYLPSGAYQTLNVPRSCIDDPLVGRKL